VIDASVLEYFKDLRNERLPVTREDLMLKAKKCARNSNTHSNLGSRTPRITNNSVYEQIFRTQNVSDDVLCLELRTRKPSTSWSDKLRVSTF
jgi:hypothetical protein